MTPVLHHARVSLGVGARKDAAKLLPLWLPAALACLLFAAWVVETGHTLVVAALALCFGYGLAGSVTPLSLRTFAQHGGVEPHADLPLSRQARAAGETLAAAAILGGVTLVALPIAVGVSFLGAAMGREGFAIDPGLVLGCAVVTLACVPAGVVSRRRGSMAFMVASGMPATTAVIAWRLTGSGVGALLAATITSALLVFLGPLPSGDRVRRWSRLSRGPWHRAAMPPGRRLVLDSLEAVGPALFWGGMYGASIVLLQGLLGDGAPSKSSLQPIALAAVLGSWLAVNQLARQSRPVGGGPTDMRGAWGFLPLARHQVARASYFRSAVTMAAGPALVLILAAATGQGLDANGADHWLAYGSAAILPAAAYATEISLRPAGKHTRIALMGLFPALMAFAASFDGLPTSIRVGLALLAAGSSVAIGTLPVLDLLRPVRLAPAEGQGSLGPPPPAAPLNPAAPPSPA